VDPADALNQKAREYELLAASHAERAPLGAAGGDAQSATAFTVIAIVLREVAEVLADAA
jgi:hypothetical protein